MFLGIYDYTVILTYISLGISVFGISRALEGDFKVAIFCLALSGLCDMFDGKIARTKKNRTDDEKNFGIQIDSLCDLISFGVFPVVLCWYSGMNTPLGMFILVLYCLAGMIRLAYYNVLEEKKNNDDYDSEVIEAPDGRKYFHGMPITAIAVGLPIVYVTSPLLGEYFPIVLHIIMILAMILFITDFRFPKPTSKELTVIIVIVAVAVVWLLIRYMAKRHIIDVPLLFLSYVRGIMQ
jgi:CDP-diacylglycerol--serine O-phosphatidyltransferase